MDGMTLLHYLVSLLLVAMATFAWMEAKSSSLIPKSLFLWPLMGFIFGVLALAGSGSTGHQWGDKSAFLTLGVVMILASIQALLVNIRKISRWPSGLVWLGLVLVIFFVQEPTLATAEPHFSMFMKRLSAFLWAAVGITKVISEKTTVTEGSLPVWIVLIYVQAILTASLGLH